MKCKRIFKVASALALTVALLVSSAVVSFAASYTTTTKYLNQNTIEVTSTASGLAEGVMATYVAYNNDGFTEANAVYIDQATANGTDDVTFVYQTNSDNVKATVKFGGSTETEAQDATKKGYAVNVTVDGVDAGIVTVPEVDEAYPEGEYLAREIPVALDTTKAVADIKVNNEIVEAWYVKDGAVVIFSNVILDDATVAITTKSVEDTTVVLGAVKSEKANTVTAFAKAACGKFADYGILIGAGEVALKGAKAYNEADNYNETVKLPALGMSNEGMFCVEIEDEAFNKGTFNVAAYAGENVTAAKEVIVQ